MKTLIRKSIFLFLFFSLTSVSLSSAATLETYIAQYNTKDAPVIAAAIQESSRKYKIDPLLIASVLYVESRYNNHAVSPVGAMGIAQLMPGTAEELNVNPYNIQENIDGGTRYLSDMLQIQKGSMAAALASYNAGPGNVNGTIPSYTYGYINDVTETWKKLHQLISEPNETTTHTIPKITKRQKLLKAIREIQQEKALSNTSYIPNPDSPPEDEKSEKASAIFF